MQLKCPALGCGNVPILKDIHKAREHYKTHDKKFTCPHPGCGRVHPRANALRRHLTLHTLIECKCGQTTTLHTLRSHEKTVRHMRQCPTIESENYPSIHHEDTQAAPEEICEKKEGDLAMLRERHLPHKSKGPALCAIIGCLKRHRTGGEARSHYGKDHDDFQCYYKKHGFSENCGKTFVNSMGLRRHYADHISDEDQSQKPKGWRAVEKREFNRMDILGTSPFTKSPTPNTPVSEQSSIDKIHSENQNFSENSTSWEYPTPRTPKSETPPVNNPQGGGIQDFGGLGVEISAPSKSSRPTSTTPMLGIPSAADGSPGFQTPPFDMMGTLWMDPALDTMDSQWTNPRLNQTFHQGLALDMMDTLQIDPRLDQGCERPNSYSRHDYSTIPSELRSPDWFSRADEHNEVN